MEAVSHLYSTKNSSIKFVFSMSILVALCHLRLTNDDMGILTLHKKGEGLVTRDMEATKVVTSDIVLSLI